MIKKITYLFLLLTNCIFAQINYEKGYFVDNLGVKTECLVKNEDWRNNPSKFYFKINEVGAENVKNIQNVKEFGVHDFSKYERHEVLIDTSATALQSLGTNRNPEWSKKTLFLKLVVDGDAKLYEFVDGTQKNYFYSFKGSNLEQLVYKEYITQNNGELLKNNYYQQQLLNNLKCNDTKKERISRIRYKGSDLIKYFLEVNNCDGNKAITTASSVKTNPGFTGIKIKAGLNLSKLTLTSETNSVLFPVAFENKVGVKFGAEIEHVLGFNKNKWAVFYEPSYQNYTAEGIRVVVLNHIENKFNWKVKYNYLDHYLGFKHFMFLGEESKIFFSTGLIYKQTVGKNELKMKGDAVSEYDLDTKISFPISLGYSFKRSEFEVRYSRPDIVNNSNLSSKLNTFSFIYSYKIFDFKKKK